MYHTCVSIVPPPLPPRGNRDKEPSQPQASNVCHVSTTYIGGSNSDSCIAKSSIESSLRNEGGACLKKAAKDEVTIGGQSTHSSQVSVTNKPSKSAMKQSGIQLQISINSSSNSPDGSKNSSNSMKKSTYSNTSSQSRASSSNITEVARSNRNSKDGPKIKKLRDLLLTDNNVESS